MFRLFARNELCDQRPSDRRERESERRVPGREEQVLVPRGAADEGKPVRRARPQRRQHPGAAGYLAPRGGGGATEDAREAGGLPERIVGIEVRAGDRPRQRGLELLGLARVQRLRAESSGGVLGGLPPAERETP